MRCGGLPMMGLHAAIPDCIELLEPNFGLKEKLFKIEEDEPASVVKPKERSYSRRSVFLNHTRLQRRLKKTLYYGKQPKTDRPSLPMTGILVNLFANCGVQDSLEKLDMDNCASIARDACVAPNAVVLAMIYIERLAARNPEFLYSVPSSHLFLVTTMVASKFLFDVHDDEGVYNDEWAKSGKLELEEVNKLEISFLSAMDWSLFVSPQEFDDVLLKLEKAIAFNQGSLRGWLSVSDLVTLGTKSDLMAKFCDQILQQVVSVFLVSMTTYFLAALTMTAAVIVGQEATQALAKALQTPARPPLTLPPHQQQQQLLLLEEPLNQTNNADHFLALENLVSPDAEPDHHYYGHVFQQLGGGQIISANCCRSRAEVWDGIWKELDEWDVGNALREIPQSTRILAS